MPQGIINVRGFNTQVSNESNEWHQKILWVIYIAGGMEDSTTARLLRLPPHLIFFLFPRTLPNTETVHTPKWEKDVELASDQPQMLERRVLTSFR